MTTAPIFGGAASPLYDPTHTKRDRNDRRRLVPLLGPVTVVSTVRTYDAATLARAAEQQRMRDAVTRDADRRRANGGYTRTPPLGGWRQWWEATDEEAYADALAAMHTRAGERIEP